MLSLVNDQLFVFNETLIDVLLNKFDRIKLKDQVLEYEDILELESYFLNMYNIKLIFLITEKTYIHGDFVYNVNFENQVFKECIIIYIPKNYDIIRVKDIFPILLHELSHKLTNDRLPKFFNVKSKTEKNVVRQIENRYLSAPVKNISFDNPDVDLIKEFLNYIFQKREIVNFAVTFAIDFRYNNIDWETIYQDNNLIIMKYIKKEITLSELINYFNQLTIDGDNLKLLFQIQYFVKIVNYPAAA